MRRMFIDKGIYLIILIILEIKKRIKGVSHVNKI